MVARLKLPYLDVGQSQCSRSRYVPTIVGFLSLVVALFASFTLLESSGPIFSVPQPRQRRRRLLGGAIALRIGIWTIHFVGVTAQLTKRRPHIAGDAGTAGNTHQEPPSCLKNTIVNGPVEVQPSSRT
jgi:hypothetical protein